MEIEAELDVTAIVIWALFATCFMVGLYHWKQLKAMELGYQEVQTMGERGFMWQKPTRTIQDLEDALERDRRSNPYR